jgi:hypothetical protein
VKFVISCARRQTGRKSSQAMRRVLWRIINPV